MKRCHWLIRIGSGTDVDDGGEAAIIRDLINDNHRKLVIFDVGANKGRFLNFTASCLGDRLREIHSADSAATIFKILAQNASGTRASHPY